MSEIRVNNIVAADGSSAPSFPSGFSLATGMGITNSPNLTGSAVTFSGLSQITNATDSTSSTTGALVVTGGVGIAKDVYIGAGLSVAGTLTYEDVTNVDSVGLITAKSGINVTAGDYTQTGGGELKVGTAITISSTAGVSTFSGDVVFDGATEDRTVTWDKSADSLIVADNATIAFGNSSDLLIYHDASNSRIKDTGTGSLKLSGSEVAIENAATSETMATFAENGAVSLYYDNSVKLATTYEGAKITGFTSTTAGLGVTGGMWEGAFIKAGKLSDNKTIGISTSNVFLFTTTESTTSTPNIIWNDSYALSSKMAVGDAVSITIISAAAAAGYSANLTIDGNAVTEEWSGGSAPSEGGASGYDVYTYTLVRKATGTGDTGWLCLAALTNFA